MEKITVDIQHAQQMLDWLKSRGGIAVWRSIDLSDPSASCFTPALTDGKPTEKPHWKYANKPERIVTGSSDVIVRHYTEIKRFHVALRVGAQGFTIKCTYASSRRIEREIERAGEGATYHFDYETQEAVIMKLDSIVPLDGWEQAREKGPDATGN